MMNLQLAIALSGADKSCRARLLGEGTCVDANYSEPVLEYRIVVKPGDLVALDRDLDPPQVVYRWFGQPANPEQLRVTFFPKIQAMYDQIETWNALNPKQGVEQGYDQVAERYLEWIQTVRIEERTRYTAILFERLPSGACVLDVGCGAGVPTAQELARKFQVTGVDISKEQIALARRNVPTAEFFQADITQLDFQPASFDAVISFYTLIHIPRDEQSRVLQKIGAWLRPGGLFVATMSTRSAKRDFGEDFLGGRMFWSGFDAETNKRLVEDAGLHIIRAQEETAMEFGKPVTFLWVVADKPNILEA